MADERIIEVYRRERGQIARSVARIAGDNAAEDIVHDAFEAYLSHSPWANKPGAWISRVARNRALNTHRGMRLVPLDGHEQTTTSELQALEKQAVGSVVGEALAALPDRPRTALRLRFFEGASYEEVAETLGIRVPQAHVVVHRALRMLGREMVRRLADAHGAGACAPALARMAGIGGEEAHGHGPEPCMSCAPAWDEIVALRAVNGFAPWLLGLGDGMRRFARRVFGTAARPDVAEPAGRVVTALTAFGVAAASAFAVPAAVRDAEPVPAKVAKAASIASVSADAIRPAGVKVVAPTKTAREPSQSGVGHDGPGAAVKTGPKGSATAETKPPPDSGARVGVIYCPPELPRCVNP